MEKWVCPSDRQLALRAKLGTGWSVHTLKLQSFTKSQQLTIEEQEQIMVVIQKADTIEENEQQRIGRLVDRVDNMKRNAIGNGSSQCILCGDEFRLLGASPTYCDDCKKAVCSKCGVDTTNSHRHPLWLCKICSEKRELWKRSGAWFFKGIPKHTLPSSTPGRRIPGTNQHSDQSSVNGRVLNGGSPGSTRSYNTWSRTGKQNFSESSGAHYSDSDSDDDISMSRRHKRSTTSENDTVSIASSTTTQDSALLPQTTPQAQNSNTLVPPSKHKGGDHSATESDQDSTSLLSLSRSSSMRSQTESMIDKEEIKEEIKEEEPVTEQDKLHKHGIFHRKRKKKTDTTDGKLPEKTTLLGSLDFYLQYDNALNTLNVRIVSANNLKAMDSNGLSDPYVKLHLLPGATKSTKLRTKTIQKTLNPEWNETLVYNGITPQDIESKTLRLSVLDEDRFGFDHIGEYRVALKSLVPMQTKQFDVYLNKHKEETNDDLEKDGRGKILIVLRYQSKKEQLIVGVIRCSGLIAMDTNGYSDPYVKLYLKPDPSKKSKHKTAIKKKTLNPEYKEEFRYAHISISELAQKTLDITVWDHDLGSSNDYLGGIQLGVKAKGERLRHWYDALKQPDKSHECWHTLSPEIMTDD